MHHVDQHDGDVSVLSRMPSASLRRVGLDQVLAQLVEDDLVAQELGRLVVDQQDVDLVAS